MSRPIIKVVEDDDTFFFGPNAVLFIQHGNKQIQITFNEEGGANLVQFENPAGHGWKFIDTGLDGGAPELQKSVQVYQ
ncbi:hypothetical protein ACXHXM_34115